MEFLDFITRINGGGGLGAKNGAEVKIVMDFVLEESQERRKKSLIAKGGDGASSTLEEVEMGEHLSKIVDINLAEDENFSVDDYFTLSTDDDMRKLRSYPGIGVKTAVCVAFLLSIASLLRR